MKLSRRKKSELMEQTVNAVQSVQTTLNALPSKYRLMVLKMILNVYEKDLK